MNDPNICIEGRIVRGHQVASGTNLNPLFPGGTLQMQLPFFKELGFDLSTYHLATLNVSIAPRDFEITNPDWHFEQVNWHPTEPPEDFSFVAISASVGPDGKSVNGLIYYPHPETKPAHHQPRGIMEILLESFVEGLKYGSPIRLEIPNDRLRLIQA